MPSTPGGALDRVVGLGGGVDGQPAPVEAQVRGVVSRLFEGVLACGAEGDEVGGGPAAGVDARACAGPARRARPATPARAPRPGGRPTPVCAAGRPPSPRRPRHGGTVVGPVVIHPHDVGEVSRCPWATMRRTYSSIVASAPIPCSGTGPDSRRLPVDVGRQRIGHVGGEPVVDRPTDGGQVPGEVAHLGVMHRHARSRYSPAAAVRPQAGRRAAAGTVRLRPRPWPGCRSGLPGRPSRATHRGQDALAVALGLGRADPGDVEQLLVGARTSGGDLAQGGIVEDHVGRDALLVGDRLALGAQDLEQVGVRPGQVDGGRGRRGPGPGRAGAAARAGGLAVVRRRSSRAWPRRTGSAASVTRRAP